MRSNRKRNDASRLKVGPLKDHPDEREREREREREGKSGG